MYCQKGKKYVVEFTLISREVLFVNCFYFVSKWAIWKARNDIKYNITNFQSIDMKKIFKRKLKSNTAIMKKSLI